MSPSQVVPLKPGLQNFPCLYMSETITWYLLHCRRDFDKLISCVTNTVSICAPDEMSPEQINNFVKQNFQENAICEGGGILVPSLGSQCSFSFNKICSSCLASYREMFASRPADGSLCWWVDTVEVSLQIAIAKRVSLTLGRARDGGRGSKLLSPKGQKFHLGFFFFRPMLSQGLFFNCLKTFKGISTRR